LKERQTTLSGLEDEKSGKLIFKDAYEVSWKHIYYPVIEVYESIPALKTTSSNELLKVYDKTDIPTDVWGLWQNGRTKLTGRPPLITIVDYCEKEQEAGDYKHKLRHITHLLMEDGKNKKKEQSYDAAGILAMLVAHGDMCNVQKKVGIDGAYHSMVESLKDLHEAQTMGALLTRLLRDLRLKCMEEYFHVKTKIKELNTHNLIGFQNKIAVQVGLPNIPDPHEYHSGEIPDYKEWDTYYTVDKILDFITKGINDKPKKIPYDLLVTWYENHSLLEDTYEFLGSVFDEDTGLKKKEWIYYLLQKYKVIYGPDPKKLIPKE